MPTSKSPQIVQKGDKQIIDLQCRYQLKSEFYSDEIQISDTPANMKTTFNRGEQSLKIDTAKNPNRRNESQEDRSIITGQESFGPTKAFAPDPKKQQNLRR